MTASPPTSATLADRRRELRRERHDLAERRPPLALAAAGGDDTARMELEKLAAALATVDRNLDDLASAEIELARVVDVERKDAAAARRQDLGERLREARAVLGRDLINLEAALGTLDGALRRVSASSATVDQLAAQLDNSANSTLSITTKIRVIGRVRSVFSGVWASSLPGIQDHRALGADDAG